ncbi:hypothetical protein [Fulvivirga lutimaris]|uniref:hypothetical protein n=1 Tax=Fulvivirga lutimaris TaxID=1819566 RepID=UPI0012BBF69D|nr:hypothetical protein [Fulvivirga lutimaris]MTI41822.1 hypothetical protein [Fulvivirga lutimaris]
MNFEELASAWKANDQTLESTIKVNRLLVKNLAFRKIKSSLYEIKWTSFFELAVNVLFYFFLVNFIRDHLTQYEFLIPAILLLVLTIVEVGAEIFKLYQVLTLDAQESVLKVKEKLTLLKRLEIIDTYSLYIIIPVFSGPFFLILAKGLLGIDLYQFDLTWMIQYVGGSFVVAAILVFILKRFPNEKLKAAMEFINTLEDDEASR